MLQELDNRSKILTQLNRQRMLQAIPIYKEKIKIEELKKEQQNNRSNNIMVGNINLRSYCKEK